MKYLVTTIITISLLFICSNALALSCSPLEEKIIIDCKNDDCKRGIYVYDIPSSGACGRRPVVETASDWQIILVSKIARILYGSEHGPSVYELSYKIRWYKRNEFKSDKVLIDTLLSSIAYKSDLPHILRLYINTKDPKLLEKDSFYKLMNDVWVAFTNQPLVKASNTSYEDTLKQWKNLEQIKLEKYQQWVVIDWGLLIIGATLLAVSVYFYFRNIHRYFALLSRNRGIILCLGYQFVIFLFSVYWFLFHTWEPLKLAGLGLFVVIIWFFEVTYSSYKFAKSRKDSA